LTPCFEAKFGWKTDSDKAIHNSLLGASLILGMTLGALSGGILMRIGRRKSFFIICLIAITGNCTTIYIANFYVVILGRFIFGFSSGLFSSIAPKFMEESIPGHTYEAGIAGFMISQALGNMIANLGGAILPDENDTIALVNTNAWLVLYVYFPVGNILLLIFLLLTVIRSEPIKFLVVQGRDIEAIAAIRQMYKYAVSDYEAMKFLEKIRSFSGKKSSGLTLKDALCND